jgi:YceI-like domain
MILKTKKMKISKLKYWTLNLLAIVFIITAGNAYSQSAGIKYVILPGSKLWIEGSSTINDFTCTTEEINGYGLIYDTAVSSSGLHNNIKKNKDQVHVSVYVTSLDCGKAAMNNDMYNAMKSNEFPLIRYDLSESELLPKADTSGEWVYIQTKGKLSIAGETNAVSFNIKIKQLPDGEFRLTGNNALSMHDYGIIPPSHFFGLIKAHDKLVVYFDLLVGKDTTYHTITNNNLQK